MLTRFKLVYSLPVVLGGFAIIITVFAYLINVSPVKKRVIEQKTHDVASTLNMMQSIYERLVYEEKWSEIRSIASTLASRSDIRNVIAVTSQDLIITSFNHSNLYRRWQDTHLNLEKQYIDDVIRKRTTIINHNTERNSVEGYTSLCPATSMLGLRQQSCGFIFMRIDAAESIARETASLQRLTVATGLGISLIASLLWLFIHLLVTRRTVHLVNILNGFIHGDRKTKANISGNDEIALLGKAIDYSLDTLNTQEHLLMEKEAFQRAILDSSQSSIIAVNTKGKVTYVNRRAEQLTGYSIEEIINDITPTDWHDKEEVIQRSRELGKELGLDVEPGMATFFSKAWHGETYDNEWTYIQKSGNRIPVQLTISPVINNNGEIVGAVSMAIDISLRKQAERAILDSEQRVRAVLNAANDAIITTNIDGKIINCNPVVHRLFGYLQEELKGKHISTIISDSSRFSKTEDRTSIAHEETQDYHPVYEVTCLTKHGDDIPMELSISHYYIGDQYFFTGIFRDISERKKQEQEIINAMARAEQGNRAKSAFLATMSHEIRTPLNGMLGMAQILNGTALNSEQKEYVGIILNSGNTLLRQINDVLDLSKIEANKIEIESTTFDLVETCETTIQLMQGNAIDKGISLNLLFECRPPELVIGDGYRIRQILLNLIGNAIKFTNRGEVKLHINCEAQDDDILHIRFRVIDTGIGIPPDKIDQLFNPFTQADQSTTRKYGGSGLGLSICKKLADLMGAELQVSSSYGEGTTVSLDINLRIAEAPQQSRPTCHTDIENPTSGQILLVEESSTNPVVVESVLNNMGLNVTMARNGQQAVDIARDRRFDLILMDCQIPILDAFEATRRIREFDTRTPIVALTENAFAEDVQKCLDAGMNDWLHKPIDDTDLQTKVAEHLKTGNETDASTLETVTENGTGSQVPDVDFTHLKTLHKSIGNLFDQLIPGFLEDTDKALETITELLATHEHRELERIAHTIKSGSRNIGAFALGDIAEHMELAMREENIELFEQLKAQADQAFAIVSEQLRDYYQAQIAS